MSTTRADSEKIDIDERLSALITNAAAVRAIAGAVENTLGPKGLDTMLVDGNGEIIVTNAGVTILDRIEVSHPAARMLINIARNQHERIGDGTTTATIIAGTLVNEGLNYVIRGVPVTMVIEGIRTGIDECLRLIEDKTIPIKGIDDPLLFQVASVAGRNNRDIADKIVELAKKIGMKKLLDPVFKLSERIIAHVGADNEVFSGLIIKKRLANENMPKVLRDFKILALNNGLRPEELDNTALNTESGFSKFLAYREEFKNNISKLVNIGIKLIVLRDGIDEFAKELFTREKVAVITRLSKEDFENIVEFVGATPVGRTGIEDSKEEIEKSLGYASYAYEDVRLGHFRLSGGAGEPLATFLVGATTEEVVGEKERIASDAASSLQAALAGGVVPGGGAFEIGLLSELKKVRNKSKGMVVYGIDCVIEALKRPMAQIVANAGFNPLEKIEEVLRASEKKNGVWGIDCDSGKVINMLKKGIVDPAPVKKHALIAAREVAEAILRINTIIKMRNNTKELSSYTIGK